MMSNTTAISIARDFSIYPGGRLRSAGPWSGEEFREDILWPLLKAGKPVMLDLDGTKGYGPSFFEEIFGGLIRHHNMTREGIYALVKFKTDDPTLLEDIKEYINRAMDVANATGA